jgi:superfamily II DNA or RNA helicase
MVHSLAKRPYPKAFYSWPGLVMVDEVHRIGARTWSPVPAKFRARWRLGVTATARRKDGCERVFWDHIGATLYTATEKRLAFKVRRVWTNCQPPRGDRVNTGLAGRAMLLTFLCANLQRNTQIVKQLIEALRAGRKVIVLSERLDHLDKLRELYEAMWLPGDGPLPSIGRYVGGMTREEREQSEKKRVVFATYQYASEGLDVPPLDTAFLASPYSDVEQTVGRIQRPYEGKKEPVVVDFRDDDIAPFKRSGEDRDAFYRKEGALSRS